MNNAMVTGKLSLRDLRMTLQISQAKLAYEAGINVDTLSSCERSSATGRKINSSTARAVLQIINKYREANKEHQLNLADIDWIIRNP